MELCSVCLEFFFNCECEYCECLVKKANLESSEED